MKKISAVVIGASGYTGAELLRLLLIHPNVEIKALVADSNAGKTVAEFIRICLALICRCCKN